MQLLPKTVAPLPDELLAGWLSRLAASDHCEVPDLLAHLQIEARHVATMDLEVEARAAERIFMAGRIDPACVQSMTFAAMPEATMRLTAQVPFQACPARTARDLALKHWRRAWAFDCQVCGARLLPTFAKQDGEAASKRLVDRARHGAGVLKRAANSSSASQLHRAMRAVTFAMGLKALRGDPACALQSSMPEVRLFCLVAVGGRQLRPLAKAALFSIGADDYARIALLRAYEKELRLLATINQITRRKPGRTRLPTAVSHT
ncbi:TniQ family protein [Paracoccus benzoatiresistens]|uniref:TniQ family protein n=1 Tax=Paracoccus benzoatiresistens TaxID=2997341 RepID=A0ABT4JD42_9RHOB|nr:TniQ family protein [Paracoccus sp. EF6]MCZ0964268.1 TniQ family protein [Paracoccus sp. EF6]